MLPGGRGGESRYLPPAPSGRRPAGGGAGGVNMKSEKKKKNFLLKEREIHIRSTYVD